MNTIIKKANQKIYIRKEVNDIIECFLSVNKHRQLYKNDGQYRNETKQKLQSIFG